METSNPQKYHRRSIRIKDYDYSQSGAYFVTINTYQRELLFGQISADIMTLNEYGKIVRDEWLKTTNIRREIVLDEYIIMPNHFHAIVIINNDVGAYGHTPLQPQSHTSLPHRHSIQLRSPSKTIGALVRGFKSAVTRNINRTRNTPREHVWQRNYYEHIVRDDEELNEIREYITTNPTKWASDRENPVFRPQDKP